MTCSKVMVGQKAPAHLQTVESNKNKISFKKRKETKRKEKRREEKKRKEKRREEKRREEKRREEKRTKNILGLQFQHLIQREDVRYLAELRVLALCSNFCASVLFSHQMKHLRESNPRCKNLCDSLVVAHTPLSHSLILSFSHSLILPLPLSLSPSLLLLHT